MVKYPVSAYVQFRIALKYIVKKYYPRKRYELAEKAKISSSLLSNILNGKKAASFNTQESLANACGYSYENFLALGRKLHPLEKELSKIQNQIEKVETEARKPPGGWPSDRESA